MLVKIIKFILVSIFLFLIGIIGGFTWQAFILPRLALKKEFQNFSFVKEFKEKTINVYPKEEIVITENIALVKALEKTEKSLVRISSQGLKGKTIETAGIILTNDGLIVTLLEGFDPNKSLIYYEGEKLSFQIIKKDSQNNLVLIKTTKENLPTVAFADWEKIKSGERVFLIGIKSLENKEVKIINEGIIKYKFEDFLKTNIKEEDFVNGSPLFNINGDLIGINLIDNDGLVKTISVEKIKELMKI